MRNIVQSELIFDYSFKEYLIVYKRFYLIKLIEGCDGIRLGSCELFYF